MNKLWLFFYLLLSTVSYTFFLSAYDEGIRKERAHRKSYRAEIDTLQQKTQLLQQEINSMQKRIVSQQAQSANDTKIIATLKKENQSLKQDKQKILSALDTNSIDVALEKINHLLIIQTHTKNISKKVHILTNKKSGR